jgi:ABC-2 type transport system permease protein
VPFCDHPVALGPACTLFVVNVFPARRARDLLMLMGSSSRPARPALTIHSAGEAAAGRVAARHHRLLRDAAVADHAAAAVVLGRRERCSRADPGAFDWLHQAALVDDGRAFTSCSARRTSDGISRLQPIAGGAEDAFAHFRALDCFAAALPLSPVRRQLLVKDIKIFLRDVSQWVQLLPLLALVLLYLYNFSVLDLERIPYMSGFDQERYAFVNLGMAGFVMATVAVRSSSRQSRQKAPLLDHPHVADLDARLPVVEVLDGALPVLLFTEA